MLAMEGGSGMGRYCVLLDTACGYITDAGKSFYETPKSPYLTPFPFETLVPHVIFFIERAFHKLNVS